MSEAFNVQKLKAATNEDVPSFLRAPEVGTTTNVLHDTILEFGLIGKGARIVNLDTVNNLTVRLHDAAQTAQLVPPSSEMSIEEWFNIIVLEPDGATGSFQLTLELATLKDARR